MFNQRFAPAFVLSLLVTPLLIAQPALATQPPTAKSPATQSAKPQPPGNFSVIKGWGPLVWGMNLTQVQQALTKNRVPYKAQKDAKGLSQIRFKIPNGEGLVHFDAAQKLSRILIKSPDITTKEDVRSIQTMIQQRYGAFKKPGGSTKDAKQMSGSYIWENPTTRMTITITHFIAEKKWVFFEEYEPMKK